MRTRRSIYKSPRASTDESKSAVAKNAVEEDDYITGESQSSVEGDNTENPENKDKPESKIEENDAEQSEGDVENDDESEEEASEEEEEGEEMFQISTEPMDAKEASDESIPKTSSICSFIFSGSEDGRSALFRTGKIS